MLRTRVVPDSHYLKSFELTSVSPNTPFYTFSTVILSITCSSPKVPFLLDRLLDTLRHPGHLPLPSVSLRPPYFLSPLPAFRPITLVEHLFRPPSPKSPVLCTLSPGDLDPPLQPLDRCNHSPADHLIPHWPRETSQRHHVRPYQSTSPFNVWVNREETGWLRQPTRSRDWSDTS